MLVFVSVSPICRGKVYKSITKKKDSYFLGVCVCFWGGGGEATMRAEGGKATL